MPRLTHLFRNTRILALVMTLLTTGCPGKKKSQKGEAPRPKTSCQELKAKLPRDFIQGTVEVPEDYGQPGGRKIKVFYYGRLGKGNVASTVFYNGGPAESSHGAFEELQGLTKENPDSYAAFPILYIDQRGTGCSDHFPEVRTLDDLMRSAHYGSTEIVKDSEVVRKKLLGNQTWKIYGQSFGGTIGKRYLQIAPEGVRSLHLHGLSSNNDALSRLTSRIRAQNRMMEEYFAKFPDDRALLSKVEGLLTPANCVGRGEDKTCGRAILYSFTNLLGFRIYWDFIHQTLGSFLKNGSIDGDALAKYGKLVIESGDDNDNPGKGVAGAVISWVELGLPGFTREVCTRIFERLRAEGAHPESWPLHECRSAMTEKSPSDLKSEEELVQYLSYIPTNPLTLTQLTEAARRHPEIPFFLYAGGKDTYSPPDSFDDEVRALGSLVHFQLFPDSGHEGYSSETTVWVNLLHEQPAPRGPDAKSRL